SRVTVCARYIALGRAIPDGPGGGHLHLGDHVDARRTFGVHAIDALVFALRSEERRVGKECRSRWWPCHYKKKTSRCSTDGCPRVGRSRGRGGCSAGRAG